MILLIVLVGVLMAVEGYFFLYQSEAVVGNTVRKELRAHALSLQITLEDIYRSGQATEAQRLIDHLSENPQIYGASLFDEAGRVVMVSDPSVADDIRAPEQAHRVISTGISDEFVRQINEQEIFCVIMPIRVGATRRAAFGLAQPMSLVAADLMSTRRKVMLARTILIGGIFLIMFMVARNLSNRFAEQKTAAARDAEARLARKGEQMEDERLASVGRLAAGVAHEIGTALNVIDAHAKKLLVCPDDGDELRSRSLGIIRAQVADITRIVRQLLNLAEPLSLRREPVELSRLINNTLAAIEADAIKAGINIEFVPGHEIQISVDQELLHQALLNVFLNSMQAMPAGGSLRVECVVDGTQRESARYVAVRIADTGPGIGPEHLAHIFDPFYTTKDIGEGSGLGLAVSWRIVAEHGGWIEAANRAEGGAIFTVYLPEAERPLQTSAEQSAKDNGGQDENQSAGC